MRRDTQQHHEKALTLADVCQAIERRVVPHSRVGDEYVVREADARRVQRQCDDLLSAIYRREMLRETLEVGRSA